MPLDKLPGEIAIPTREEIKQKYLRDFRFRAPAGTATGEGTQPDIDASVVADALVPIYAAARTTGQNMLLRDAVGEALDTHGEAKGLTRLEAIGASGYVKVVAAAGGGTIFAGDELKEPNTGLRFQCSVTDLYLDGRSVPIVGVDTGPATNLKPGTVLGWTSPRPGIGPNATVVADAQGDGLLGGRAQETDDEYRSRIEDRNANPPASGNDAEYQSTAEATPGISVQKAFTYPAILGPGTVALVFTLRPAKRGASRIPNPSQIAAVEGWVRSQMPGDDGLFASSLFGSPTDVALTVTWRDGVPGWVDATPWPPYYAPASAVIVQAVTSATVFTLKQNDSSYVGVPQPQAGQTIAFYDAAGATFRRKRILSFTGTGPWVVTCDAALNASDTTYTPVVGQRAMPWSDSLPTLIDPVADYFDSLGPGEQASGFFDPGIRQKRSPASPREWPHVIGNRLITSVLDADSIQDATLKEPTVPYPTPVGAHGVSSFLLELQRISAFPQ